MFDDGDVDLLTGNAGTDWFLFNDRTLRIAPPLTIDEVTIQKACEVLLVAMDGL